MLAAKAMVFRFKFPVTDRRRAQPLLSGDVFYLYFAQRQQFHMEYQMFDDNQVNNEELLQMAITAAKSGQKDNARLMLRQIYGRDKRNESVMLWLAKIARSQKERVKWLERIIEINPDNETAYKALKKLNYSKAATDNRTMLIFGGVAAIMVVLTFTILFIAIS